MTAELIVRTLNENEFENWNHFVAGSSSGSIYALPAYLRALCEVTNARFSIVGVFKGDELIGGMPLYLARSRAGLVASNRLLLYYHSPVIRDYATQYSSERTSRQLATLFALEKYLRKLKCAHMLLHVRHAIRDIRPFLTQGWSVSPNYSYEVSISDLGSAWARIEQNLRRLIDRAAKKGLVHSDDHDFDSLFRMHTNTRERKGMPLYLPEREFRRFFENLKAQNLCRLFHARLADGRAVASQLVLTGPHPVCHTVCAGADNEHLSLGSTPFLRWKSFEALSQLGYAANDLTDAALNDVTRFKSQFGGELVTNWVIVRPESVRYRLFRAADRAASRARRLVKGIVQNSKG